MAQKLVKRPSAKHLLFGINQQINQEMGAVSCMAAFQLAQRLKRAKKPYEPAIDDEVKHGRQGKD